jgi:radical SAM superfamily enzyme YgiQ (UPF0313 family)
MTKRSPKILLFNPWIYDFAAYDFWIKPMGLLLVGSMLRQKGYQTFLVDCLDRHHPVLLKYCGIEKAVTKANGTGKFYRKEIEKSDTISHIPRQFSQYGMPIQVVDEILEQMPFNPDYILVTSIMTYWYPAVKDAVNLLRVKFPQSKIVLGGVYATLCRQHALENIVPDHLIAGEGELPLLDLLNNNEKFNSAGNYIADYSSYENLESIAILTSKGCPFNCSFCASKSLVPNYSRRDNLSVIEEIEFFRNERNIRHFTFYDDALLHQPDKHIKPLLREIIKRDLDIHLHTPNGLQIRYIDNEMAELFYSAGVKTIRLSFETSNKKRQKDMCSKVSNSELEYALINLENAGFSRKEIAIYIMMGLPQQDETEFKETVNHIFNLGAQNNVSSFSPIPRTVEWDRAVQSGFWNPDSDLLLTNNSLFPIWTKKYSYSYCCDLLQWAKQKNTLI